MSARQNVHLSHPFEPGQTIKESHPKGFTVKGFWRAAAFMGGLTVLVIVGLAVSSNDARAPISGIGQTLAALGALGGGLWASRRVPAGRARWAVRFLSSSMAFYLVGNVVVIVFPVSQVNYQPGIVSAGLFICFYVCLAVGTILLPSAPTTTARQVRLLLDVSIVIGALLGPVLVFLIIPRFVSGNPSDAVYIAYPLADTSLVLVAAIQLVRGIQRAYRPSFFWLALGMLFFVYADTSFNVVTLPVYSAGASATFGIPWIDPFWVAGLFGFALAALSLLIRASEEEPFAWLNRLAEQLGRIRASRLLPQFLLLALPVAILFSLILFTVVDPFSTLSDQHAAPTVALLTLVVVLLILIRQLLTMSDLVDARIAVERAQQLDGLKDQFITSVNHELRTPMMTMQGYIEILSELQDKASLEKRTQMLERAQRANTALVQLLKNILDVRNIDQEAGDFTPESVNVREAAQAALSLIDPREGNLAERRLYWSVSPNLQVWGDPVHLQQVLTNLLSNAIKYSTPGTAVTLIARPFVEKTSRFMLLSSTPKRQMVEITVHDEGLGIPPEQIPFLFRRFVRLPRDIASKVRGTGLGLYLCRLFVEAMGGVIWVESSGVPGEGSTFYLRLPVQPTEPLTSTQPHPAVQPGERATEGASSSASAL
ncbi:MAG TPA: HAMP domain-containing sensor histidine kinase [Ktedonobacterales bacterium]|jgi:signal transduction histidine kinase